MPCDDCSREDNCPPCPYTEMDQPVSDTRTRTPNPYTAYKKAKAAADRARKAATRAVDLEEKARIASEKANVLVAEKDELEEAEANAYDALQNALADLNTDTDEVDDLDEDEFDA